MARERSELENGFYLAYPITRIRQVIITVLQTTTGGGTMLEGGVSDAPVDLHTEVQECGINEGDYLRIVGGRVIHPACVTCRNARDCQITAVK